MPTGGQSVQAPVKVKLSLPPLPSPRSLPIFASSSVYQCALPLFPSTSCPRTLQYTPKKQSLTHACKQISENACPHTWHSFRAGLVGSSMHSLWAILASPYVFPVVHWSIFNLYRIRTQGTSMERTRVSLGPRLWSSISVGFSDFLWTFSLVYFSPSTALCFKVVFMHSSFSIFPLVICTGHLAQEQLVLKLSRVDECLKW